MPTVRVQKLQTLSLCPLGSTEHRILGNSPGAGEEHGFLGEKGEVRFCRSWAGGGPSTGPAHMYEEVFGNNDRFGLSPSPSPMLLK